MIPASAYVAKAATASTVTVMNPMDVLMSAVNTNPYFIGVMMLLLNLGGRFLALEISKEQEKFLAQPAVRRFFLFAVLFVATRNFVIAAGLAVIVIILLGYLLNENSELCLWRSCLVPSKKASDGSTGATESFTGLSSEEAMILKRLQDKQMSAQQKEKVGSNVGEVVEQQKTIQASDIYNSAIQQLHTAFYSP